MIDLVDGRCDISVARFAHDYRTTEILDFTSTRIDPTDIWSRYGNIRRRNPNGKFHLELLTGV